MKSNINRTQFIDGFQIRPENFSYDGLCALWDYLIELEDETDNEMEFDPIAICCEFTEYDSLQEFQDNYGDEFETIEDIGDHTTVLPLYDEAFIIQNF